MDDKIKLIKEIRNKSLERIIAKSGSCPGTDLNNVKMSIIEIREILYETCKQIALREVEGEF